VRTFGQAADRDIPFLFHPSLAFNLLLDREPLFDGGLAVQPPRAGAPVYFLVPWQGRTCAGTYHAGLVHRGVDPSREAEAHIPAMLEDLNAAVPGWRLHREAVIRVLAGLLPASRPGSSQLATRPVIYSHGAAGGPPGLVSISGVKFTTARLVAERALRALVPVAGTAVPSSRPDPAVIPSPAEFRALLEADPSRARNLAAELVRTEAVLRLDDLLLRRTDWGILPDRSLNERLADMVGAPAGAAD
jgi:glycerol-3-phosphate dehydrogenase